ncbi:MAG: hypothetical protein ABI262_22135, partial [Microcoleus sp.]
MSGIDRQITLDSRHIAKHLPDTPQMRRLLNKGRAAHIFNNEATMNQVAQAIMEEGEFTDRIRGYERYGMFFLESICYRVDPDGSRLLLYYGEIKVDAENRYHVTPRTR